MCRGEGKRAAGLKGTFLPKAEEVEEMGKKLGGRDTD